MNRPRVVSVTSKDVEERLPPDEAGVSVLESYVPAGKMVESHVAGIKPSVSQAQLSQAKPQSVPQANGNVFNSLFFRIRSLFGR